MRRLPFRWLVGGGRRHEPFTGYGRFLLTAIPARRLPLPLILIACLAGPSLGHPDYDPSYSQVGAPFTSTMNDYVRGELGYKTNLKYFVLGEGIWEPWNLGSGTIDESEALRSAMHQNPYTKLFVASGYYDLACPVGTVDQILNQLELDSRLKGNVSRGYCPAGHMMYLEEGSRKKLHADVAKFIEAASTPTAPTGVIR